MTRFLIISRSMTLYFNKGLAYPQKTQFDAPTIFLFCTGLKTLVHVPAAWLLYQMTPIVNKTILLSNFKVLTSCLHAAIIIGPPERVRFMFVSL